MEEKNGNLKIIVAILTLVIVVLIIIIVLLIKNQLKYVTMSNTKKTDIYSYSDKEVNKNDNDGIRIEFDLKCQATAYMKEPENLDSEFSDGFNGKYYIGGDILIYGGYENGTKVDAKIKVESPIIDIKTGTNFNEYWIPSSQANEGETYNFMSSAYFLFKDGTIGKISTDDIKQGNYKITKLNQYKNIMSLVSCVLPEESGGDCNLYAVDNNNNIYELDKVSTGA